MPLPTSDLRRPVCMEMKNLSSENDEYPTENALVSYHRENLISIINDNSGKFRENQRPGSAQGKTTSEHKNDMGSVDSSDTYASCNTHPFLSEGDLTSDIIDQSCAIVDYILDSNLYINPLDLPSEEKANILRGLKKSASGDTAFRNLMASSSDEVCGTFVRTPERGSRGSLDESPIPKHRKTRFQQGVKPRNKGDNAYQRSSKRDSQESLEGKRDKYFPARGFVSASKIINQHLFGLQNLKSSRGKSNENRSSTDSIDSRFSTNQEQQRRSKSILKKPDSSQQRFIDPETEKLISDSTSGRSVSISTEKDMNFASDLLLEKKTSRSISPPERYSQKSQVLSSLKSIGQKSSGKPSTLPVKFSSESVYEKSKRIKSPLLVLEDFWGKEKRSRDEQITENKYKDKLEAISCITTAGEIGCCGQSSQQSPLYICPPPPAIDDASPTEETKLITGSKISPLT